MYFKENLTALRKKNKYSQNQLAIKLNVNRYNISDWEQGRSEPSFKILHKICIFFGVTTDSMLNLSLGPMEKEDVLFCESTLRRSNISNY